MHSMDVLQYMREKGDWVTSREMSEDLGIALNHASAWLGFQWKKKRAIREKAPEGTVKGFFYLITDSGLEELAWMEERFLT